MWARSLSDHTKPFCKRSVYIDGWTNSSIRKDWKRRFGRTIRTPQRYPGEINLRLAPKPYHRSKPEMGTPALQGCLFPRLDLTCPRKPQPARIGLNFIAEKSQFSFLARFRDCHMHRFVTSVDPVLTRAYDSPAWPHCPRVPDRFSVTSASSSRSDRAAWVLRYRAVDQHLEREVALKVLHAKTLNDDSSRKRFRREALILSRLNHPNVEAVYDFHSDEGIDFLVLEYVQGVSLDERLRAGPLLENEAVALAIQLTRGLTAAHAQNIIHRDLKPGNLRVTPEGILKILDFGIAQLVVLPQEGTLADTETVANRFAGTLPYSSPEQLLGKEADVRSDIYSAGAVLYELVTGSRPFPQVEGLPQAILKGSPPSPRLKKKMSLQVWRP